jgi:hypothetical protein
MTLKPIRNQVLLKLDPENRMVGKLGLLHAPDADSIAFCRKCGRMMEAITQSGCEPEEIHELDPLRDRYVYKGLDTGHQMDSVEIPVVVEKARRATVIASGSPDFDTGERVLVDFASGSPPDDDVDSPYRLVKADAVLARIEEEA